jgi:hypothetical protein
MRNPGVSRRGIAKPYVPGSTVVNRVFNQKCHRGGVTPKCNTCYTIGTIEWE